MHKYKIFSGLFVIVYILLLLAASLFNQAVVVALVGSAIVVFDKYFIPKFSKFQEKSDLIKNFNKFYEIMINESLEEEMAIDLKFILDKIGRDNLLKVLKLTFTSYKDYMNEEYDSSEDYALSNNDFYIIINFRFGRNSIKIYKNHILYSYKNSLENWEIRRDFIKYIEKECRKEGIKLKNKLLKSVIIPDMDLNQKLSKSPIDFELVFSYLEMLEKGIISSENIFETLSSIDQRLQKINTHDDFSNEELSKLSEICERLVKFMLSKDDNIQRRVLSILYDYTFNEQTIYILKNYSFEYIITLFNEGKNHQNLYQILDKFDFFDGKLAKFIIKAIESDDQDFLHNILGYIDFSKHQKIRLEMISTLNQLINEINNDNRKLIDLVKKVIRKFE